MLRITVLTLGMALLIAGSILFAYTFLKAYSTEDKRLTITINQHGEADFELIMVILTLIFIPFLVIDFFYLHKKELERYFEKKYHKEVYGK